MIAFRACSAFPRTRNPNHPTGNDFLFIALTDRCDREAAQLRDQLGATGGVITHRRALLLGQHHDVQTILRHIDTAEREHCHLRIPSLLMRARAQQLYVCDFSESFCALWAQSVGQRRSFINLL
jgi:hypothetical protein